MKVTLIGNWKLYERFKKMENVRLPEEIDYSQISGISREVCEKLTKHPATVAGPSIENFRHHAGALTFFRFM
jgi:tRNA uridine 5-carboxymethylaminomethyl modification enzyme